RCLPRLPRDLSADRSAGVRPGRRHAAGAGARRRPGSRGPPRPRRRRCLAGIAAAQLPGREVGRAASPRFAASRPAGQTELCPCADSAVPGYGPAVRGQGGGVVDGGGPRPGGHVRGLSVVNRRPVRSLDSRGREKIMMMKYLVAGGTFVLVLAIPQMAPAEAAVSSPPAAAPALASGNAPETFVLVSSDLATVGVAPREDGTDSSDDGSDDGDDAGQ